MLDQRDRKRQISPHPRSRPRRRSVEPLLTAAGAAFLVVFGIVALLFVVHPWSGGGSGPKATRSPLALDTSHSPTPSVDGLSSAIPTDVGPTPSPTDTVTAPPSGPPMRIYVVQRGDTISSIAATYHITRAALLAANPQVTNAAQIRIGQKLNIPWPPGTGPTPAPSS